VKLDSAPRCKVTFGYLAEQRTRGTRRAVVQVRLSRCNISMLNDGRMQEYRILHIRDKLHKLVVITATCRREQCTISPSITHGPVKPVP
jgi:hypothetical protein